jgi:hypothetical protein
VASLEAHVDPRSDGWATGSDRVPDHEWYEPRRVPVTT